MLNLVYALLFIMFIAFGIVSAMADRYLYLYSPQKLLIKRNPKRSLVLLIFAFALAGFLSLCFYQSGDRGWQIFIPFVFVLAFLWYHLYCTFDGKFMVIDLNTGEIEIADVRKIKLADVLYLELYTYGSGSYIYTNLCFVLQSLKKADIRGDFMGMDTMIKELTTFLNMECKDNRD